MKVLEFFKIFIFILLSLQFQLFTNFQYEIYIYFNKNQTFLFTPNNFKNYLKIVSQFVHKK